MSRRGKPSHNSRGLQATTMEGHQFSRMRILLCKSLTRGGMRPRQALRYIIRNTTLPQRVRATAQLKLSQMHCYTRSTQIRNRCVAGDVARGIFRKFRISRVSISSLVSGYLSLVHRSGRLPLVDGRSSRVLWLIPELKVQFRAQALAGELPGVRKATW